MVTRELITDPVVREVPHRIVLTGGPLAGKSTVMNYLQGAYGDKARFMTEVASMLLTSGYPKPGADVRFSSEWLDYINKTIMPTQVNMENGHLHAAVESRRRAVFFDRGLLDPAAYIEGGKATLQDRYGLDTEAVYDRYSMVIHMQSLASINPSEYERLMGTNPARYDTVEQAQERDTALIEAWKDHPNWVFIGAEGGMDAVIDRVLRVVSPLMDLEIERKFLLGHIPIDAIASAPRRRIEQRYLVSTPNCEVRVRRYDDSLCELCVKDKGAWSRLEWESRIPEQVYQLLVDGGSEGSILKTRYFIPHGGHTLELDVYDKPANLCTLECEFHDERAAEAFVLPAWAHGAVDVTDDPSYKNAALAVA